ncbi:hypothetical protein M378DRAFT_197474 [Amanita muscaria Koide BX008]|uniref:Uncharacterized protein n=1 Tax=Amanita muscaria (strain Koide BX008) TaxID=946122 RepID=A0A0C2SSP6_AMAMK|nr:hypothetical protein M378DRAFT_197474 [Amanita muscaria Koide BX008]
MVPIFPQFNPADTLSSVGNGPPITVYFQPINTVQAHRIKDAKEAPAGIRDEMQAMVQELRDESRALWKQLEDESRALRKQLEDENRAFRKQLEEEVGARKALEEAMEDLRQMVLIITPLHLRALLDRARKRILVILDFGGTWEDLANHQKTEARLVSHICANVVQLEREVVRFVCSNTNVRRLGNIAAHKATKEDIEKAVKTHVEQVTAKERVLLEQLFDFTFGTIQ